MIRSGLVVLAVAGIAVAAAVHGAGLGGGRDATGEAGRAASQALAGPDLPQPGALAGSLLFAADGCRLHRLELATVELERTTLGTGCAFWVSPGGKAAVVAGSGSGPAGGREIRLVALGEEVEPAGHLGLAAGDVAWSPRGDRLAWCTPAGATVVAGADGQELGRVEGCRPRFTPGGRLLTTSGSLDQILADGRVLLDERDLRRPLPSAAGPVRVLGYDVRADGLLAVVVASGGFGYGDFLGDQGIQPAPDLAADGVTDAFGSRRDAPGPGTLPRLVMELWRGSLLEESVSLRGLAYPFANLRFGEVVQFSPDGRELAIGASGAGVPVMLVDAGTLEPLLRPTVQHGFSWSPDGAWFALAREEGIRLAGAVRTEAAYLLPLQAASLAWR